MQFTPKAKRQFSLTGKRDNTLYPHSLQFYKSPPSGVIPLEEFEELALERLKGLLHILLKTNFIRLCHCQINSFYVF